MAETQNVNDIGEANTKNTLFIAQKQKVNDIGEAKTSLLKHRMLMILQRPTQRILSSLLKDIMLNVRSNFSQ